MPFPLPRPQGAGARPISSVARAWGRCSLGDSSLAAGRCAAPALPGRAPARRTKAALAPRGAEDPEQKVPVPLRSSLFPHARLSFPPLFGADLNSAFSGLNFSVPQQKNWQLTAVRLFYSPVETLSIHFILSGYIFYS